MHSKNSDYKNPQLTIKVLHNLQLQSRVLSCLNIFHKKLFRELLEFETKMLQTLSQGAFTEAILTAKNC